MAIEKSETLNSSGPVKALFTLTYDAVNADLKAIEIEETRKMCKVESLPVYK